MFVPNLGCVVKKGAGIDRRYGLAIARRVLERFFGHTGSSRDPLGSRRLRWRSQIELGLAAQAVMVGPLLAEGRTVLMSTGR